MLEEWTKELTPAMLPEGLYRKIAEKIGPKNLLELAALVGGSTFYLPKQKQILRQLRDKKIREEYNGYNTMELSQKYDISERWIRELIRPKNEEGHEHE